MPVGQLRQLEQFAQTREEVAFQRSDGEDVSVGPVATIEEAAVELA